MVRDYAQGCDCGVLLVEQHVPLALAIADDCYVLSHGDLVLHEPADVVRERPELLVTGYLGQSPRAAGAPSP